MSWLRSLDRAGFGQKFLLYDDIPWCIEKLYIDDDDPFPSLQMATATCL